MAATATSPSDPAPGAGAALPGGGQAARRLLVVEHDWDAPAGVAADWAVSEGFGVRIARLHAGDPLPARSPACDAAVVLGSGHTAYDDSLPWLGPELSFVEMLLAREIPVLGICFGAQVLARVLGARLYRLGRPELGWIRVDSRCPGIAAGPWLSWHRDAFTLPPGASELAASGVSLQAFSLGPHAGVQFHPEATADIVGSWLAATQPPPGREITAPLAGAGAAAAWQRSAANAAALFSSWLSGGLGQRPVMA